MIGDVWYLYYTDAEWETKRVGQLFEGSWLGSSGALIPWGSLLLLPLHAELSFLLHGMKLRSEKVSDFHRLTWQVGSK